VAASSTHRAIEATLERARHFGAGARDALADVPPGPSSRALDEVVDFCIGREN
jgi:octaprenyl-diphosphate synthase